MAKKAKTLDELFHDTLKDIYFAEKKILATLPKMEKAAQAPALKRAFAKHKTETEGHVGRLEKVFAEIDKKPQTKTCDAIVGITDEGAEIMKEYKSSPALDAGLLAAAQAVEHYEISRYGTLKTWASELGLGNAVGLLDQNSCRRKEHRCRPDRDCRKRRQSGSGSCITPRNRIPPRALIRRPFLPRIPRNGSSELQARAAHHAALFLPYRKTGLEHGCEPRRCLCSFA